MRYGNGATTYVWADDDCRRQVSLPAFVAIIPKVWPFVRDRPRLCRVVSCEVGGRSGMEEDVNNGQEHARGRVGVVESSRDGMRYVRYRTGGMLVEGSERIAGVVCV